MATLTNVDEISARIPSGSTSASAIFLGGRQLVGVRIPGDLSGTGLSFKVGLRTADALLPLASGGAVYQEGVMGSAVNWLRAEGHLAYNVVQFIMTGTAQGTAQDIYALVRPI